MYTLPVASIIPRPSRNGILLSVAVVLAAQIPTTIGEIGNPTVRALVITLVLLLVLWASYRVDPKEGLTVRPPPGNNLERPEIPPAPRMPSNVDRSEPPCAK